MLIAELDSKLLLAIQYVCKVANIAVPWDDIAHLMGPATTGSDVLDYLATTRTQMVAKGLDVPPPLNFRGKMTIDFVVSPTPTKVVNTVKSGSKDDVKDHQIKGPDVPSPLYFHGKMKIDFIVSQPPTKKNVQQTVIQTRNVVTNDNTFAGAYDWSMGDPIPYSYLPGLRERFERLQELYPDPSNNISWNIR